MILGSQVGISARDTPDDFRQDGAQIAIAFRDGPTEPLPSALLVAWTDSRPRSQMLGGRETTHILPNLGNDGSRRKRFDRGNALQELHRFLRGTQPLIDFRLYLLNGFLQKIDVREDLADEEAMMSLHTPLQGLPQLRQLGPQPPTGQSSQAVRIVRYRHQGFQHRACADAQHIGHDRC